MRVGVVICAAAIGAPALASPARSGAVFRVERPRVHRLERVRVCPMMNVEGGSVTCFGGAPPAVDARVTFLDHQGFRGRGRVTAVRPSADNSCDRDGPHEVRYRMEPGSRAPDPGALGVFGLAIDRERSRLIADLSTVSTPRPDGREQAWVAIDHDGDGRAELVVTAFECTRTAPRHPLLSAQVIAVHCLDYWSRANQQWSRLHRDLIYSCE